MAATMRCYYEVLNVDRKADEDEIRRAYKKAALRWHPDRNHGNEEEAALAFKEVQNAYTVLNDSDERAWYDSHRESILRGGDGGTTCAPDELNPFDYFSANCYGGFSDNNIKGFYNVYRQVFETITKEESEYNDKITKMAPNFGDSTSPWSEVGKFYNYWKHFMTNKTFAWKDEHKLNEIPDRYYRREAERINLKARAQARKEYTSALQQLVHHIYIRDPRVLAEKEREEKEREEKAIEREKREAEAARRRREANKKIWEEAAEKEAKDLEERAARGEDYDGANLEMLYEMQRQLEKATKKGDKKAMKQALGAHAQTDIKKTSTRVVVGGASPAAEGDNNNSDNNNDTDDDSDDDDKKGPKEHWRCNGCKKTFASDKMFQEHVKSNKHKTKLKQLEKQGVDVSTLLVVPGGSAAAPTAEAEASAAPATSSSAGKKGGAAAAAAAPAKKQKVGDSDDESEDDAPATKKGMAAAKNKKLAAAASNNNNNNNKSKKKGGGKHNDDSDDDSDEAPSANIRPSAKYQKSKAKAAQRAAAAAATAADESEEESSEEEVIVTKNKFAMNKKKK